MKNSLNIKEIQMDRKQKKKSMFDNLGNIKSFKIQRINQDQNE